MSRIAGTPTSNKRNKSLSLYSKKNRSYNLQRINKEDINNLLNNSKLKDIISLEDLTVKDYSKFLKRLDSYDGLFSTAQLGNIDYSKFEEHTFFDSASSKVINAYTDIFNNFPYDKDYFENIDFYAKIDGYTNYILKEKFAKEYGFVKFTNNIKIKVKDQRGSLLNDHATKTKGLLNPNKRNFSFNFWLYLDDTNTLNTNNNQVIFKKISTTSNSESGFISYLTLDGSGYYINFKIYNDGVFFGRKAKLTDGVSSFEWKNIYIAVKNINDNRSISFYLNGHELQATSITNSANNIPVKNFSDDFIQQDFVLGNSESLSLDSITYNNLNNVWIDEFRYFFKTISKRQIINHMHKSIFAQKGLVLYLKLNEPGGAYTNNAVLLDSSGNKLHGTIQDNSNNIIADTTSYRHNSSSPLVYEKKSPVLFSNYSNHQITRQDLLTTAGKYDNINPNIIFKLFPKHYFLENSELQNLSLYVDKSDYIENNNGLGINTKSNTMITNLLIVWARFFDNLKCYIDSLNEIINLNYDSINENRNLGMVLPLICKRYGFDFKEILPSPLRNKLDGENLTFEDIKSEYTIRQIQNILWKRLLINSKNLLESKGTKNAIKNIFHSFGVDFDKFITIREFASTNKINNIENYYSKQQRIPSLSFLNENIFILEPVYTQDYSFSTNKPHLFVDNIKHVSDNNDYVFNQTRNKNVTDISNTSNGLSSEWTFELFVNYNKLLLSKIKNKQSLLRINETNIPYYNLYAIRSNNLKEYFDLYLDFVPYAGSISEQLVIKDVNLFEGVKYINVSSKIVDNSQNLYQFDLKVKDYGYVNQGRIIKETSKIINKNLNELTLSNKNNLSLQIGNYRYSQSLNTGLGNITDTNFDGNLLCLRMWKKYLNEEEVMSHYSDIENIGTNNINIDLDLLLDCKLKFAFESSDITNSTLNIKNYKLFKKILNSGVEEDINSASFKLLNLPAGVSNMTILNKDISTYSKKLSYKIDEPNIENRFNIVSYKEESNKKQNKNYNNFPISATPDDFDMVKDARVSVEISNAKFVNEDISKFLSSLNDYSQEIIKTQNIYSYDYNFLKENRKNYFALLEENINHKTLINFFKYFDNALSEMINSSIPDKVGFLGFNFVYESHILERHKYEYKMSDSRIVLHDETCRFSRNREMDIGFRNKNYIKNRTIKTN